mmetsp:Transcript_21838/g.36000  ORF Transcript_21838/g.36000 Transcript_21838/m.36000 type:complete len:590 (-) Transcript_21838:57-1826(-)
MEPEDTQSEYPNRSLASKSTVFDTQSEPPGISYTKVDKILKRRDSSGRSLKSLASIKPASVESPIAVCAETRSVVSSSSNASKLDAKLQSSTRSRNNTASIQAGASRAGATAASSKKKDPSVTGSNRSAKSKSSKIASSSCSNNKLALVPKSKSNEPPTNHDSQYTAISVIEESIDENQRKLLPSESQIIVKKGANQLGTIDSASGDESEYDQYSGDFDDDRSGDSYTRASELASAVGRALVERRTSVENSELNDELVQYDGEYIRDNVGGILVSAKERYLASAVDNMGAMVPVDSDIYEAYDHTFVICPEYLRFRFLYTFLRKNLDKKILIFFSTSASARYHSELLKRLRVPVLTMHSRQRRDKFVNIFFKFSDIDEGILCTTDAAGRDLDIPPSVDYVMQFEPPDDPSEYILRIARISCDSDRIGRSLLFLNPGEQGFLKYYNSAAITVSEFELPKLAENQLQIENIVNESERLLQFAKDAYGSYLIAYASHGFRDVYNVHDLNKGDVATSFGLVAVPAGEFEGEDESTCAGSRAVKGKKPSWEITKKSKTKTWMKGEKSWPHAQIKLHPKFKESHKYDSMPKDIMD